MTKPGDSQTKKTLHELAKEFPEKTYRELEKYRDADRQEEALGIGAIGHNHSPDLVEVMAIENDNLKFLFYLLLELDTLFFRLSV